jgi:hypothetical protein
MKVSLGQEYDDEPDHRRNARIGKQLFSPCLIKPAKLPPFARSFWLRRCEYLFDIGGVGEKQILGQG